MNSIAIQMTRQALRHLARLRGSRLGGTRTLVAAAVLLLLAAAVAGAASFAALSWNNASGGSASLSTNWTPNQVPTSTDDLTFNVGGSYGVTFNSASAASRTQTFRQGTVLLTVASPHAVSNGITVGDLSGDVATTTLSTGTLTSSAAVNIGDASGSTGTLNVGGANSDFVLATTAGDLTVGNNGAGDMNITGGGLVQVADRLITGSNSTSTADISVSGRLIVAPFTRSTLDVDGTAQAATVGSGGDVTMSVSNGALASFAGSLNVAQGSTSSSSLTIGGPGLSTANVTVANDLRIGANTTPAVPAGFGVVTVGALGALDVGGALGVGNDPNGGTGFLLLDPGGAITTGSLNVGAGGELDLDGGTLDVDGGTFTYTNPTIALKIGAPDSPLVTLENGAAGTLTSVVAGRALTVGGGTGANTGDFDVRTGSSLTAASGDIVLGETSDDDGGMIVNGAGSSLTTSPAGKIVVGQSGTGELQVEIFATASLGTLHIGENFGSEGVVAFESDVAVDVADVYVGGSNVSKGGIGEFRVASGAVCNVGTTDGIVEVWETGELHVLGGTLNADEVRVRGALELVDGTIDADDFSLESVSGGGSGTINARVILSTNTSRLTATGDLAVGDSTSLNAFINVGVLDCGAATVTILDRSEAALNTTLINGGTLIVPTNGCSITASDSIFGTGTIDADIENFGKIIPTGAAGLTFKGVVDGVGQGFRGTVANFADGGGFTGDGEITASITADSTSSFTLTGNLILGDFPLVHQLDLGGALDVGAHTLNLRDVDTAELGGTTTLDGGVIFSKNILLRSGGAIEGIGAVNANFVGEADSRITPAGSLSIGDAVAIEGFKTAGRIEVGSHIVTINTDERARLGRSTTIAGGTLGHNGTDFFYLESADTISGFGTVTGGIRQGPGSVIRAEGALTIGPSGSGVPIFPEGGRLDVNSSAVTLIGPSGVNVSTLTTIQGGSIASASPITVPGASVLRGFGTIDGDVVNTGTIEVGDAIGVLTVTGDLDNAADGTIAIQVGGAGNFDKLVVAGRLDLTALGGGTLRIGQLPGLVVSASDSFSVISGAPLVGQFDNVVFDDPYLDNLFDIWYTPTQVFLIARAATGVDLPPVGDPGDGAPGDGGVSGAAIPESFALRLASRNPFTPDAGVSFEFDVPRGGAPVGVSVFDASGRRVAELVNGSRAAGTHAERWTSADLHGLSSGVYFLRMDAGAFGATKKLVLTR